MQAPEDADLRRQARELVDGWRGETRVVAVLAGGGGGGPAAAAALAEAASASRRTLLVNLAGPASALDRHLGSEGGEGLHQTRRGDATVKEIARKPAGRGFLYLPAGGAPAEGGEEAPPALQADPGLQALVRKLAERVREGGGTLLLYLDAHQEGWRDAARVADGLVRVAGAEAPTPGSGVPQALGALPRGEARGPEEDGTDVAGPTADAPRPETGGGEEGGEEDGPQGPPSVWRRHRSRSGAPWGRIAVGILLVAVLAGGWWLLAREAARRGATASGEGASPPARTATAPDGPGAEGRGDDTGTAAREDGGDGGVEGAVAAAPELPYSVLVASYARWTAALRRLDRWGDEALYFVAPTPVRGGLYHRLFAGAFADRASAEALMSRLVEWGRKDQGRTWDVRPVGLAYRLEVLPEREAARRRAASLRDRAIPAYLVPAGGEGDTVWQVYAGAFEDSASAAPLGEMLEEEGLTAELVRRRGAPASGGSGGAP